MAYPHQIDPMIFSNSLLLCWLLLVPTCWLTACLPLPPDDMPEHREDLWMGDLGAVNWPGQGPQDSLLTQGGAEQRLGQSSAQQEAGRAALLREIEEEKRQMQAYLLQQLACERAYAQCVQRLCDQDDEKALDKELWTLEQARAHCRITEAKYRGVQADLELREAQKSLAEANQARTQPSRDRAGSPTDQALQALAQAAVEEDSASEDIPMTPVEQAAYGFLKC